MKKYWLLWLLLVSGCQQSPTSPMHVYYSAPELMGMVFFNDEPIADAKIFLLTSCDDKSTITDTTGYFAIGPACMEFIPTVANTDLGFFYQVVIVTDSQQFLWKMSGLGYGFKTANVVFDLATQQVNYQIVDGVSAPYEGIDVLSNLDSF